jgi:hypothetical protein
MSESSSSPISSNDGRCPLASALTVLAGERGRVGSDTELHREDGRRSADTCDVDCRGVELCERKICLTGVAGELGGGGLEYGVCLDRGLVPGVGVGVLLRGVLLPESEAIEEPRL